jgi:glycosyltransferase involved in cell wall biosynthesis
MPKLSVNIIALNAGIHLQLCLKSVQNITDDIVVVVDSRTSDDTVDIAQKYHARIFMREFDDYSSQKNYAILRSGHEWILSLDADEEITPELGREIAENISAGNNNTAYRIPRLNYIFHRPIYHTNWGPEDDSHIWLFKKTSSYWAGKVHEEIVTAGPVGNLKNSKLHHSYTSVEEFMGKMNKYTSLQVYENFSYGQIFISPLKDFFRRYIWHRGFLDGWHGLFLSYLMFIYHLSLGVKTWQKTNLS